jgi:hypothetical protein
MGALGPRKAKSGVGPFSQTATASQSHPVLHCSCPVALARSGLEFSFTSSSLLTRSSGYRILRARWHGQNKNWSSARDQMPCKPCVMIRAEHGLGSVRDSHRRVMIRFDPIVYWPCISTIRAASQLRVHARSQGNATRSVAKLVITRRVVVCRRGEAWARAAHRPAGRGLRAAAYGMAFCHRDASAVDGMERSTHRREASGAGARTVSRRVMYFVSRPPPSCVNDEERPGPNGQAIEERREGRSGAAQL